VEKLTDYMNYEIIRREGYIVLKVITYPPGPTGSVGKVVHFLPTTILQKGGRKITK